MSEPQVAEQAAVEQPSDGAGVDDWKSMLPEEIRDHRSLATISDVGNLAKSYVNAQSMIGADKVVIPGKHATPEERMEFYQKIGRPENASDYAFDIPDGTPQEIADFIRDAAHASGLTADQANTFFNNYNEFASSQNERNTQALNTLRDNAVQELKSQWGDAYEDRVQLAQAAIIEFSGSEENANTLSNTLQADGTKLGDNPNFIRLMSSIGHFITDKIGEDEISSFKPAGTRSPDEIQDEIAQLTAPTTPYWDKRHPEHEGYVRNVSKLYELLHPQATEEPVAL
tara:strand:+ start:7154 stop:8008 length:855 start_codon:yes stop_codon:yes gene_type:complete